MRDRLLAAGLLLGASLLAQDSPLVEAAKKSRRAPPRASWSQAAPVRPTHWFNSPPQSLERLRGRVVLLDFWATWCGSCVKSLPKVHELARGHADRPLTVLLLHAATTHVRERGQRSRIVPAETVLPAYIRERGITLPVAVATREDFAAYDARGIPTYVLIDKQGRIRYQRHDLPPEALVRQLLAE